MILFFHYFFLFLDVLNERMFCTCSGYGIAAQALTAVVKAYDGRGPLTVLTSSILKMLGLSSPDELIGYIYLKFIIVIITFVGAVFGENK